MTEQRMRPARKLPGVIIGVGSLVIAFHLFALLILVLAAESGPWSVDYLMPMRSSSKPPHFAGMVAESSTRLYLQPLGLANDFHFDSNHTDLPSIEIEVNVLGEQPKKLKFPDPHANAWVRYRQSRLVQALGRDYPFQAPQMQEVAGVDQKIQYMTFFFAPIDGIQFKLDSPVFKHREWGTKERFEAQLSDKLTSEDLARYKNDILDMVKKDDKDAPAYVWTESRMDRMRSTMPEEQVQEMYHENVNRMPKVQVFCPAPSTLVLVKSFARYLERQQDAKVELVRNHRHPINPALMLPSVNPGKLILDEPPMPPTYRPFHTYAYNFGDGTPKKWAP